jgi:spermidine/putrescine transport system ATP-binding protein
VQIGVRPEKLRLDGSEANTLDGAVAESAYIGVSTQYIVKTAAGAVALYVQNERSSASYLPAGVPLTLSWNPESTFIVDSPERAENV